VHTNRPGNGTAVYAQLGCGTLDTLLFLAGWVSVVMATPFICMTFVDKVGRIHVVASGFFYARPPSVEPAVQKNFLGTDDKAGLAAVVAMTHGFDVSMIRQDMRCLFHQEKDCIIIYKRALSAGLSMSMSSVRWTLLMC
jgi:hypothetical protein